MADDPAERALSDSKTAGGGAGKALVPQWDGELSTAVEAAQDFVAASRSKATLRAYKSDWDDFEKWCDRHCLITLPADSRTVAAYLSAMATGRPAKLATIRRRRATISYAHRCAEQGNPSDDPAVKATMAGIARTIGSARTKKTALTAALVTKVVKAISAAEKRWKCRFCRTILPFATETS
jgi:site-specific recombinase XerD